MNRKIENGRFAVELSERLSLTLTDLRSGMTRVCKSPFKMNYGGCYDYDLVEHCHCETVKGENSLTVKFTRMDFFARFKGNSYRKPEPGPDLQFEFSVVLEDDHVVFKTGEVKGMDAEPLRVTFPDGLFDFDSSAAGGLLVPCGYGSLIQFPRNNSLRFDYAASYQYNIIPLLCHFAGDGGLFAYVKTPYDTHTYIEINSCRPNRASAEIAFEFSKDLSNYGRELHVYGLPRGAGYVEAAKLYRGIVKAEGRFVSLEEKIKSHPDVERLVGAVVWKHDVYSNERPSGLERGYSYYMNAPSWNQYEGLPGNWTAKELFDTAQERGFDRVCVFNTGWNRHGYDSGYPTRLPPNPERGTEAEFQKAAEYARSLSPGFIYSVHDNYLDVYANSSEFDRSELTSDADGVPVRGFIWRGGRACLLCGEKILKYARRDIPKIAAMLGKGGIYVDVIGQFALFECRNPGHPLGKRECAVKYRELMRFIKDQMGSLATEGAPSDQCADIVDLGAYCSFFLWPANRTNAPVPLPVPFWQLVYHDSVLNYTAEGAFRVHGADYLLLAALYGMLPTQLDDAAKRLSFGLRSAYKAEMLSHEFLEPFSASWTEDGCLRCDGVAKTVFSDGTTVVANFKDSAFVCEGTTVPPRDYVIIKSR